MKKKEEKKKKEDKKVEIDPIYAQEDQEFLKRLKATENGKA